MRNCFSSLNCSSRGSINVWQQNFSYQKKTRTILIVVEPFQEYQKFFLVPPQNCLDLRRFLRVCHEDLHLVHEACGHMRYLTFRHTPWTHGMLQTGCSCFYLVAGSSSFSGSIHLQYSVSLRWNSPDQGGFRPEVSETDVCSRSCLTL